MKTKGEIFKAFRESNRITQPRMAAFLHVDQNDISKFETSECQLSIDLLEKCSDLFGCSVRVFFEEDVELPSLKTTLDISGSNLIELADLAMINRIFLNLEMMEQLETKSLDKK